MYKKKIRLEYSKNVYEGYSSRKLLPDDLLEI